MTKTKIISFMRVRNAATVFSIFMLVVSLYGIIFKGLNFGLDFTGGVQVEFTYEEPANLDDVRAVMDEQGFENYEVALFGSDTEVLVRLQDLGDQELNAEVAAEIGSRLLEQLTQRSGAHVELAGSEFIGSVVGDEMKEQGALGILVAAIAMLIYITLRFQFKFGLATVASLTEDVIITVGFFALTQMTFDLTVMAALLAVIGYGLNDTVVICDRIRENVRVMRKTLVPDIIDISLSQVLGRTIITSLTTLMVLVTLALVGGETLRGFSVGLIVGVIISTYSSIFVATKVLLLTNLETTDLIPDENKEEDPEGALP